jgi:hypothetical protein
MHATSKILVMTKFRVFDHNSAYECAIIFDITIAKNITGNEKTRK